jgi:hypothetical protein
MHMLAGLSELIEYFKSIPSSECHLILYDTILQHNYSAGIEHQVVIPVPMELSQEHKTLNTIFQAWTDWTVESELVALPYDEDGRYMQHVTPHRFLLTNKRMLKIVKSARTAFRW